MKEVKDRLIQYPRRFKLTLVEGETDVYELTPVTGTVQEEGTPINAELFDSISADIEAEKSAREAAVSAVELKADTHIARVDNPHSVTKSQIGLGNVDNTSDANKPISTAAQEVFDSIENNLNNLPDIYEKKENLSVTIDNVKLNEQFTLPEGVYDKIVNNKNFTLVCNSQDGECVKFSAWSKANFLGTDFLTSLSVLSLANMSSDVKDDSLGGCLISISKQSNLALAYIKQYILAFDGGTFSDLTAGAAIADIDGNNIPNTYAKKTEIPDISNFAEKNGTYPEMTVGNATNAETANNSAKLGGVAAANYAQINGTYANMTVGNATNATNADTADSATSAQDSAKLGGVNSTNYAQIDGTYSEMTVGAATKATQDGNGDNIADTYAKQNGTYPNMTVGNATNAVKATQDGNGNNIANTYAPINNSKNIYNGSGGFSAGQNANANGRNLALGYNAKATAIDAIQLGAGTNSEQGTCKIRNYKLLDSDGKIPLDRMPGDIVPRYCHYIRFIANNPTGISGNVDVYALLILDFWDPILNTDSLNNVLKSYFGTNTPITATGYCPENKSYVYSISSNGNKISLFLSGQGGTQTAILTATHPITDISKVS